MPSIEELRMHFKDNVKTDQINMMSSDNLSNEEQQFLDQYNTTLADLISMDIDAKITAENFFKTPNTYDKNYVRMYYAMLERLLYSCTYKVDGKKPNKSESNYDTKYEEYKKQHQDHTESLKLYNSYCNLLDKLEKETLKILEKEDRIISNYYAYRLLYKNLQLAKEYIEPLKGYGVSFDFLKEHSEKINKKNYKDGALPDFKKQYKTLLSAAKKAFKDQKLDLNDFLPPDMPFWRKILIFFGSKIPENIRHNYNESEFNTGGKIATEKLDSDSNKLRTWMSSINSETKLKNMHIPGSHDAGTYKMGPKSTTDIVGRMAKTQTGSIMGQLRKGVRYFDLRIRKVKDVFVFYHGIVNGSNALEGIKHINKFIEHEGKNEVIILSFEIDNTIAQEFVKLQPVKKMLEKVLKVSDYGNKKISELTLRDFTDKKKNILIFHGPAVFDEYKFENEGIDTIFNSDKGPHKLRYKARGKGDEFAIIAGSILNSLENQRQQILGNMLTAESTITTPSSETVKKDLFGLEHGESNIPAKDAEKNYATRMLLKEEYMRKYVPGLHHETFMRKDNVNAPSVVEDTRKVINSNYEFRPDSQTLMNKFEDKYNSLRNKYTSDNMPEYLQKREKFMGHLFKIYDKSEKNN